MNNVYEENKCIDLHAEFKDIRDKVYQLVAARSTPTHFSHTYTPHKPCSYCFNPYHSENNCPSWGQFSNSSYEQINTSFSNPGCDSNFNFYNPNWSNQSDFTWLAQATGNYAHQFDEVHHSDYLQFDHQAQPSAYQTPQPAPQFSLEEMMKAFMQSTNKFTRSTDKFVQATDRNIQELKNRNQELKNATMANNRDIQELKSYVARIKGQIGHLVTELNRIEEELQSQLIIEKHYMSDEDKSEIFYHEHVQVTTTLEEDEVMDNEEGQVDHNERIEHHEKSQPPTNPNLPSDMEASTKAPACITAPLETHQEHKVSSLVHL
jgi:hypothetical protein